MVFAELAVGTSRKASFVPCMSLGGKAVAARELPGVSSPGGSSPVFPTPMVLYALCHAFASPAYGDRKYAWLLKTLVTLAK